MRKRVRIKGPSLFFKFKQRFIFKKESYKNNDQQGLNNKEGSNNYSIYFILCLIILFSVSLYKNALNVRMVEKKISDKDKEVQKKRDEQSELQKKLEYTQSQEFMEKQLRDKLGLAKEGEIVVVLPPPEVLRKFAPKHEDEVVKLPDPNWKKWVDLFL